MTLRQSQLPKPRPVLRMVAACCIVVWLLATFYCNFEHLFGFHRDQEDVDSHSYGGGITHHESGEAHHSTDSDGDDRGSRHHDGSDDSCCSNLHAIAATPQTSPLSGPAFHFANLFCVPIDTQILCAVVMQRVQDRPPPDRDRVLTPEVCTGPANRNHAPPASV